MRTVSIEILEGPPELSLTLKEGPVLPIFQNCAAKVPGGSLILSAKGITAPVEGKLTYRVKYKTKMGDRQISNTYLVSLFP